MLKYAYLLQFLCHMTSDVKFLDMLFFLIYIGLFYEVKELTIKQILIFLQAVVHKCLSKSVFLKTCNFIKKRLQHRCFPVKFAQFLRIPFFTGHLRWLLLSFLKQNSKHEKIYSRENASDSVLFVHLQA